MCASRSRNFETVLQEWAAGVKPARFRYHAASTVDEAIGLLRKFAGEDPKILAGGQSLVPVMNFRLATPGHIVDINRIAGLNSIEVTESHVVLGALVRHADIEDSGELEQILPLLPRVAREIGYRQIRYRGTVGGSLAHADPAAEWPMTLRLLDAEIEIAGPDGTRRVRVDDFFVYFFTSALEADEMVTNIRIPRPGPGWIWGFSEFARKTGDFAIVAAGASAQVVDGQFHGVRIVLGGVGPTPERSEAAEALLEGVDVDDAGAWARAGEVAAEACDAMDDGTASRWYRRELVKVQVERVLKESAERVSA